MTISPSKKQRKAFRADLRARGALKTDRFTDLMETLGGARACACCTLVRPATSLDGKGRCEVCRRSFGALRKHVPVAGPPVDPIRFDHVYTDASYRDGLAGLAVVGAIGEHSRRVEASSSTHAEVLAMRWAIEIARAADIRDLTFCTDCEAALGQLGRISPRFGWTMKQIPRRYNAVADALASRARLTLEAA